MMQFNSLQEVRMRKVPPHKHFSIAWNTIECFINFKQQQASNTTPDYHS